MGVKTIKITKKTGNLIAIKATTENDDLVIINRSGLTIRLAVKNVPTTGRATQGVKLINLRKNDAIADVGLIVDGQLDEEEEDLDAPLEDATANDVSDTTPTDATEEEE